MWCVTRKKRPKNLHRSRFYGASSAQAQPVEGAGEGGVAGAGHAEGVGLVDGPPEIHQVHHGQHRHGSAQRVARDLASEA